MKSSHVIGIDEVGRGSLAGPVVVCALLMPARLRISRELGKLKDSKHLSAKQREKWLDYLKNHEKVDYAVACVYPRTIEKINISNAANLASLRAVNRLTARHKLSTKNLKIFLDGGLYIGKRASQPKNAKTIIGGDQKITSVKASSIVAKVLRDKMLVRLANKYPQYGFEENKGYGTKKHLEAIEKCGPCEAHRATFM